MNNLENKQLSPDLEWVEIKSQTSKIVKDLIK